MQNRIRSSSTTATLQSSGAKKSENQSPKSMNKTESIIENKGKLVKHVIKRNIYQMLFRKPFSFCVCFE